MSDDETTNGISEAAADKGSLLTPEEQAVLASRIAELDAAERVAAERTDASSDRPETLFVYQHPDGTYGFRNPHRYDRTERDTWRSWDDGQTFASQDDVHAWLAARGWQPKHVIFARYVRTPQPEWETPPWETPPPADLGKTKSKARRP